MLTPIGKMAVMDETISFSVIAVNHHDVDVTYSCVDNSESFDFDPVSGAFTWTPTAMGEFQFTFVADNTITTVEETITITVISSDVNDLLEDEVAFEFYLSARVNNYLPELTSQYLEEFKTNTGKTDDYFQAIVDAVNAGESIIICSLEAGWNLIS